LFEVWLPEPFMVATWIEKSLTIGCPLPCDLARAGSAVTVLLISCFLLISSS